MNSFTSLSIQTNHPVEHSATNKSPVYIESTNHLQESSTTIKLQWNFSYLNPLVVHKSEYSISLKLSPVSLNSIKNIGSYFCIFNSHYSNRAVISVVWLTKNLDKWSPDN